jgi:hypothetical protein
MATPSKSTILIVAVARAGRNSGLRCDTFAFGVGK